MGCEQSVLTDGQSERFVSQTERLRSSKKQNDSFTLPPLKLDSEGNLMPEEILARTSNSVVDKKVVLGTPETPLHVEVGFKIGTERCAALQQARI
jgi:hypothetical protein